MRMNLMTITIQVFQNLDLSKDPFLLNALLLINEMYFLPPSAKSLMLVKIFPSILINLFMVIGVLTLMSWEQSIINMMYKFSRSGSLPRA